MQGILVGLFVLGLISSFAHGEIRLELVEKNPGTYLQHDGPSSIDGTTLFTSLASLLNVDPIMSIDSQLSNKIAGVIEAQPFDSAEAVLGVAVAGLSPVDAVASGESDVLKGLANARHLKGVEVTQLDTTSLPGCGEACLEQLLVSSGQSLGLNASYVEGSGPLRGVWTVQAKDQLSTYNLAEANDRLLALEVASFWAAVQDAASEKARRVNQYPSGYKHPQILVRAFISPLMIKQTYGESSPQYTVAQAVFSQMLAQAQTTLQTSFTGRLVSVVVGLDTVEKANEEELLALTTPVDSLVTSRRSLLASEGDSDYLESFIAWVAMWGTFILLLFFGLTGSHCLRSMKFKQDSLLYGKNKSD